MNEIEETIQKEIGKEQEVMIYAYTAFIQLLIYQKSIIEDKILWSAYLKGIERMFKQEIDKLMEEEKEFESEE